MTIRIQRVIRSDCGCHMDSGRGESSGFSFSSNSFVTVKPAVQHSLSRQGNRYLSPSLVRAQRPQTRRYSGITSSPLPSVSNSLNTAFDKSSGRPLLPMNSSPSDLAVAVFVHLGHDRLGLVRDDPVRDVFLFRYNTVTVRIGRPQRSPAVLAESCTFRLRRTPWWISSPSSLVSRNPKILRYSSSLSG